MKKTSFILLTLSFISINAAVYQGNTAYIGFCMDCHGDGNLMSKKYTANQWRDLFNHKGSKLANTHIYSGDRMQEFISQKKSEGLLPYTTVQTLNKYFQNRSETILRSMSRREKKSLKKRIYKYQSRHLKDFFVEFAKGTDKSPYHDADSIRRIQLAEQERRSKLFTASTGQNTQTVITATSQMNQQNIHAQNQLDKSGPKIFFKNRGLKKHIKSSRHKISGQVVDSSGVAYITVNGKEASLDAQGNFSINTLLKIGKNKIEVIAVDIHENKTSQHFILYRDALIEKNNIDQEPTNELRWYSNQYAFIVGIDQYKNRDIPTLRNAVNDAKSIAKLFHTMGYKTIELYNGKASRKNILKTFQRLQKMSTKNDSFIFYFAGHGQGLKLASGEKTGYLIPYDSEVDLASSDMIDYDDEAIALSKVRKIAKDMHPRHIALLLDSCFSGLAMKRSLPSTITINKAYYNDILKRKAINILTAGDDQPVSDGSGHSPFTKALLQALRDKGADINDRDGFVTFNQLSTYVKEKVEKSTQRRQRPQFDNLLDDDGNFLFKVR